MRRARLALSRSIVIAIAMISLRSASAFADEADGADAPAAVVRLHDAIAEALRASPALRPAHDAARVADIQQRVAASRFGLKVLPTFNTGTDPLGLDSRALGLTLSKRLPTGTDLAISGNLFDYRVGDVDARDAGYAFSLRQPLLRGFGPAVTADVTNARRGTVTADRALTLARERLVIDVAAAYFAIVREHRLVEAGERAKARAEVLRRASDARASVGLATRLDVLRAELLASQAQADVEVRRESLALAIDQLKLLMGRSLDAPLQIALDEMPLAVAPAPAAATADERAAGNARTSDDQALARAIALAVGSRLDLHEARDRIADARRAASVARWNVLPDVSVTASYTRRDLGTAGLFRDLVNGWRVGVTTTYELDRTTAAAAVETAQIVVRAAVRAADDVEQRVIAEVRRAHRAIVRTTASIAIQRQALELAEKQLQLAELRYERGLADNFGVIDAESSVFQARSGLIAAEVDRALATLMLCQATGTLDTATPLAGVRESLTFHAGQ